MLKEIDGFNGRYLANIDGRIYCVSKKRYMKPRKERNGYLSIALRTDCDRKQYSVHRIIAKTFIDNPLSKKEVNHINGIKTDNSICNLEWCTRKENIAHSYSTGLRVGVNKGNYSKTYYNSKKITYIKDGIITEYNSIKDFSRIHGVHKSNVQSAIKSKKMFRGGILI